MELQADAKLTKRENQIAGLAFCGKAKKEIADLLNIAYGTVNVILDRAYKKTAFPVPAGWLEQILQDHSGVRRESYRKFHREAP